MHVCTKCNPPHVEDCPKCFGFGLTSLYGVPIAAGEAEEYRKLNIPYFPCLSCGGTPTNGHLMNNIEIPAERLAILDS